jgi:hypothetical protein
MVNKKFKSIDEQVKPKRKAKIGTFKKASKKASSKKAAAVETSKEFKGGAMLPSFDSAMQAHPKETTKFFGDGGDGAEGDGDKKKKNKKGKAGGNASFGSKAANLGAYVV